MPTKVPKGTGSDRSGRGVAVSTYPAGDAGKWQQNPRQQNPAISGAGGSPSMSADNMASRRMGMAPFSEEAYDGGDDVLWPREIEPDDVGDCGYSRPGGYRCPQEATMESLLRKFVRETLVEVDNRTGALGPWGRASTDWDVTPTPSLGSSLYEPEELDEEILAEPDGETDDPRADADDEMDEFSGVGGIGGFALPLGKSPPSFGRKRKKHKNAVKGWKPTHG